VDFDVIDQILTDIIIRQILKEFGYDGTVLQIYINFNKICD
jgi:hypothetical protein